MPQSTLQNNSPDRLSRPGGFTDELRGCPLPLYHDHPGYVSEMLFVSEEDVKLLSCTDIPNPFQLTFTPRIYCYFDLVKQMRRKLNPVVDIHSIFNNSNGEKEHMLGSGFIVSPPSSKEVYIFTCFHNVRGFRKNGIWYNNESVYVLLDPDRSQRPNFTVEHYCKCDIVETGSVLENELLTDHPQEDWALLKTSTELLLEEDPNFFFIPSPSKVSELQSKEEKTYSVCLQSIPSRVQELDMNTLPCNVNINIETICQYIEFDVKSASFGRGRGEGDHRVSFYDAVSFKGSSGGAVTTCNQHYEDWSLFKEKIELSNRVVGIHIGAENFGKVDCSHHVNRCCSVKNWFQCYLSKVYDPLREHFSQAFQELVDSERDYFNKN